MAHGYYQTLERKPIDWHETYCQIIKQHLTDYLIADTICIILKFSEQPEYLFCVRNSAKKHNNKWIMCDAIDIYFDKRCNGNAQNTFVNDVSKNLQYDPQTIAFNNCIYLFYDSYNRPNYKSEGMDVNYFPMSQIEFCDPPYTKLIKMDHKYPYFGANFCVFNNILYGIGGYDSSCRAVSEVYCLNILENKWIFVNNMNYPRGYCSTVVYENKLYVIGGSVETKAGSTIEYYQDGNIWTSLETKMNQLRQSHGSVVFDGKLLVFGGVTYSNKTLKQLKTSEIYNFKTNIWSKTGDLNQSHNNDLTTKIKSKYRQYQNLISIELNGQIICLGNMKFRAVHSNCGEYYRRDCEIYDKKRGIWVVSKDLSLSHTKIAFPWRTSKADLSVENTQKIIDSLL